MSSKKTLIFSTVVLAAFLALAVPALAAPQLTRNIFEPTPGAAQDVKNITPAFAGTATALRGTNITMASRSEGGVKNDQAPSTATVYNVDAATAVIMMLPGFTIDRMAVTKSVPPANFGNRIAVSDIQVGDALTVRGTLSGARIAATVITVSRLTEPPPPEAKQSKAMVLGIVQTVNSPSFTITSESMLGVGKAVTYTVDASNAKLIKYVM